MFKKVLFGVVAAGLLTSCAATRNSSRNNYVPQTTQSSIPEIGTETTASVGSDMLRQGTLTETDGVVLNQSNNVVNYVLSGGFYPQIGIDDEYTYNSFQLGAGLDGFGGLRLGGGLLGPMMYPQSIRFARNKQETCLMVPIRPVCDTEHSYHRSRRPIVSLNNFQQTLIYNGRVGDRIRIGYRESSGDSARPAFSNEAEYDLATSMEIAYRGARIRIIEADNTNIRFVVLSNFNTP